MLNGEFSALVSIDADLAKAVSIFAREDAKFAAEEAAERSVHARKCTD